jgi:hypothetical protein
MGDVDPAVRAIAASRLALVTATGEVLDAMAGARIRTVLLKGPGDCPTLRRPRPPPRGRRRPSGGAESGGRGGAGAGEPLIPRPAREGTVA